MGATLRLDPVAWDLTIDSSGNVALVTDGDPYSLAQDAASAIRLKQGELWYDTTQGIPYFSGILGALVPTSLLKQKIIAAALTVPGIASAAVFITAVVDRQVQGQVQITSTTGQTAAANF